MTKIKTGTWVLIADGEKALILENVGDDMDFNFDVVRKDTQPNPPTSEQGADAPGRFNDGPSVHRSSVETTDWHQLSKDRFAADLSDMLYKRAHANDFRDIVLVAPPKTLGALRQEMHSEVSDKVVAEIPKTMTNIPVDEIEKLLAAELGTAR